MARDLDSELKSGGRSWSVFGSGDGPIGNWELRAAAEIDTTGPSDAALYVHIDFKDAAGMRLGGSGFGGVGLANQERPLVISSSHRGSDRHLWYIGQVVADDADRVEAHYSDDTTADATVLAGDLPVKLWVPSADPGSRLTPARAFSNGRELAAIPWVREHTHEPHSGAVWGPIDE